MFKNADLLAISKKCIGILKCFGYFTFSIDEQLIAVHKFHDYLAFATSLLLGSVIFYNSIAAINFSGSENVLIFYGNEISTSAAIVFALIAMAHSSLSGQKLCESIKIATKIDKKVRNFQSH